MGLQMTLVAVGAPSSFASREADLAVRLALCSTQINPEQISVVVGPTQSTISSVLKFLIVANGPFTPLVIDPASSLVSMLQNCLGNTGQPEANKEKASDFLGLGTLDKPVGVSSPLEYSIMVPPIEKDVKLVKGWQMISFNYLVVGANSFDVIVNTPGFTRDDKIMARLGSLKFATFDGTNWLGDLVELSFARGYKLYFQSAAGGVITQAGVNQYPVENVVLTKGWNWIGHAPLQSIDTDDLTPVAGSGQFTVDDQIKVRSTIVVLTNYDGAKWEGNLEELMPGKGYECKVNNSVTFQYTSA